MKQVKEWNIKAPWGKIALISWGDPWKPPILLLHGYMDTAATFIPLVKLLSDKYYYVAFDLPGHGKSDPFPAGLLSSHIVYVEALKNVVKHMKWKTFHFLSHSMGSVIGLFYNHIYPGHIKSMIFLDVVPPLSMYYYMYNQFDLWYRVFYGYYYDNYDKFNSVESKLYTYEEAINVIVRSRKLTKDKAEVLLSRSLVKMGEKSYKFSWEQRVKRMTTIPLSEDILNAVLTSQSTPILCLDASEFNASIPREFGENLLRIGKEKLPDIKRVTINGGHDVHLTEPEVLAPFVEEFLAKHVKTNLISNL